MKRKYRDAALIEEATRLYVQEGLTINEIALRVPVSERTLQDWSRKYDWVKKRKQYVAQEDEMKILLRKLELKLARMLLDDNISPQVIYALARGISVLKPAAAVQLKEFEKAENEMKSMSAHEKIEKLREILTGYGFEEKS